MSQLSTLEHAAYLQRLEDVLQLFGIEAASDGHGIQFVEPGAGEEDQPLITTLVARRFGTWTPLPEQ